MNTFYRLTGAQHVEAPQPLAFLHTAIEPVLSTALLCQCWKQHPAKYIKPGRHTLAKHSSNRSRNFLGAMLFGIPRSARDFLHETCSEPGTPSPTVLQTASHLQDWIKLFIREKTKTIRTQHTSQHATSKKNILCVLHLQQSDDPLVQLKTLYQLRVRCVIWYIFFAQLQISRRAPPNNTFWTVVTVVFRTRPYSLPLCSGKCQGNCCK